MEERSARVEGYGEPRATISQAAESRREWLQRSDANTELLLQVQSRFQPETGGQWGMTGLDSEVFQVPSDLEQRWIAAFDGARRSLEERRAAETDPPVRQDLELLIRAAEGRIEWVRLEARLLLPYMDVHRIVYQGLRGLLDDQIDAARRPAALARLRRYAGLEDGYRPLAEQVQAFTRARFDNPGLLGPFRGELERDLGTWRRFAEEIGELFATYQIAGYEKPYQALREQLAAHEAFIRTELLPRSREDFRLPPELYAFRLREFDVDMPVPELLSRATTSFREIQNEMRALAPQVAKQRGWAETDYRQVIRELKREQLSGDAVLSHYEGRIRTLEGIIERERFVSLPDRPMRIRLATRAESAWVVGPSFRPPPLIGNSSQLGEFVVPLRVPDEHGTGDVDLDDFNFQAASWNLAVHEGRPGHDLQFATLVERGVSRARAVFASRPVNIEGWALYCEAEMKPYLPLDGQLICLQQRLGRSARAFLDPGLQAGTIQPEEARQILEGAVLLSRGLALQEVQRYTFRMPGQATSYFCGYSRLTELRVDAEAALGHRFDARLYHDFLLGQGPQPPDLLRKAVLEVFVPEVQLLRQQIQLERAQ